MASSSETAAGTGGAGSRRWRVWLAVCALVGFGFFVSRLGEIPWRSALRGYDNTLNYLWLRSAMVDGDWDFANDVALAPTLTPAYRDSLLALPRTPAGRVPDKYGIGWALFSLPFYLIADGIVRCGTAVGLWSWAPDGFNPVYQIVLQCGHLGLALLALLFARRIVQVWTGCTPDEALAGVTLGVMTSSLLYYQSVNLSMSHGATFFAVVVMAGGLGRARDYPGRAGPWLLVGAGLAWAAITRFQAAVFGVVVLAALASEWRRDRVAAVKAATWVAAAVAPFLVLQLWAWHVVYGRWLVFGYGREGDTFHWFQPHLWSSLFSPWHGLFYWHPFLLVALIGLVAWAWRCRGQATGWLLAFLGIMYVNAAWSCWWLAAAFGNRAYDAALLPLMAGLAWLLRHASPRMRTVIWTLGGVAAAWNVYVLLLYCTAAISRNEPVTWLEMLRAATHLSRVPGFH